MFDQGKFNLKSILIISLLTILTFTMWGLNKSQIDSHSHSWEFEEIKSKLNNIEGSIYSIDGRLGEVEDNSHYHRGYFPK